MAATFDDLCGLGMSATQAKRVIRYRDERGLTDPDELDQVPGFPENFLAEVKNQLVP
jgi:DNA uptake protein ComE-like DNA-binding protein